MFTSQVCCRIPALPLICACCIRPGLSLFISAFFPNAGASVASFVVDWKLRPIVTDILRGSWDYNWDESWNPFTADGQNSNAGTTRGTIGGAVLEKLQGLKSGGNASQITSPYRSTKQVILIRHGATRPQKFVC